MIIVRYRMWNVVRIISGDAKGMRLKMVPGKHVRPTADRVKESLFQVIGPSFEGGIGLDLFAGTGSLGLEALSRGLDQMVFVDKSRSSLEIVKENLLLTGFIDKAQTIRKDARSYLKTLSKGTTFDLIFVDPPYYEGFYEIILTRIDEQKLLAEDGILIAEHPTRIEVPKQFENLSAFRTLSYGDTSITLYEYNQSLGGRE